MAAGHSGSSRDAAIRTGILLAVDLSSIRDGVSLDDHAGHPVVHYKISSTLRIAVDRLDAVPANRIEHGAGASRTVDPNGPHTGQSSETATSQSAVHRSAGRVVVRIDLCSGDPSHHRRDNDCSTRCDAGLRHDERHTRSPHRDFTNRQWTRDIAGGNRPARRAEAQRRLQSQRLLLEQLQRTQAFDPEAAAQIPFTQAALEDLQQRAEKLETRHRLLTITAPSSGILVRPRPTTASGSKDQLSVWSDLPMAPHNAGSFLETGVLLGSIATPGEYDAEIQITPEQIEYVRVGQPVTVMLDAFADQQIEGKVLEVSEQEAQPAEQGRADLPTRYQVRIAIAATDLPLTYYQQGRARILVGTHPLAQRIYRALHSLFRFQ